MSDVLHRGRRHRVPAFGLTLLSLRALPMALLALLAPPVKAATAFPALERPALAVRAPQRQVMQAAALAGERIVAVGERGIVVLSDDAGRSWRQARQVPVSVTLSAVTFVDAQLGWAVGHGGVILHSRDGGETWARQADGATLAVDLDKPLLDVCFVDARRGWVVGAYNLFFETRDGGANWQSAGQRLNNPKALHLNAIRARGEQVFIVGEQGQIHRSLDGGQTFEALGSPYKGSWFTLALPGDGSLVVAGLRGHALHSADLGRSWQALDGGPPVTFLAALPQADGAVLLANQAGQFFTSRAGAALVARPSVPMPPLTGLLLLRDQRLLALGLGGVVAPAASSASAKSAP
jgi:photosystem II stability/assembly factor-like uncharacterized protein